MGKQARLNALSCAIWNLQGMSGGYSPEEIEAAIKELRNMYREEVEKAPNDESLSGDAHVDSEKPTKMRQG